MRFYAIRCNVLNGYYATICKEACCRSHEKSPLEIPLVGFSFKFARHLPDQLIIFWFFAQMKPGKVPQNRLWSTLLDFKPLFRHMKPAHHPYSAFWGILIGFILAEMAILSIFGKC